MWGQVCEIPKLLFNFNFKQLVMLSFLSSPLGGAGVTVVEAEGPAVSWCAGDLMSE